MALRFLTGICTQSAADTFTELEVPTGLSAVGAQAYRVLQIMTQMPSIGQIDNTQLGCTITRKSFSSEPNVTERSVVYKRKLLNQFTTSGNTLQEAIDVLKYLKEDDMVLVEDPIYFQVFSTATTAANACSFRIAFEQIRISETERLQLIANTLSS